MLCSALVFLRPSETWHVATRMFYTQEVFITSEIRSFQPSNVIGKCYVSSFREYMKMKPRDLDAADHFVCESRYSLRGKSIQKAKVFPKPPFEVCC